MSEEDQPIIRRNPPGTRIEDMYKWPPQEVYEMDSPIAVQQYIEQLERENIADVDRILECPKDQTALDPVCTEETCSDMSAGGQQYLCAAHGKEAKQCCAIDYCIHTIDQSCATLNNQKFFGSRIQVPKESLKYISSSARRIYRVFAHAFFHHRDVFDEFERETHLTERYVKFCTKYRLVTPSLMNIPPGFEQK